MKLSEFKNKLGNIQSVNFELPNGQLVPKHFHITEVGQITKHFIDCGGTVRNENKVNFQLWEANDLEHCLSPQKLMDIIELSEKIINIQDNEIEVEYQMDTIGKYDLNFNDRNFLLVSKHTNCLASDHCGIPKEKLKLSELQKQESSCCNSTSGCCN